jgi:hypothetical protein
MTIYLKPGAAPGSVEHFYHFVLQYLLPLFEREITVGIAGKGYAVRDCGPLNVWFDFVFGPDAFSIVTRDRFPHESSKRLGDRLIELDAFAKKSGLMVDAARFHEVLNAFRERLMPSHDVPGMVTVVDRRPPPSFYLDGRAEKPGGGNTRRSINNLNQLSDVISQRKPSHLVDFWDIPPAKQLEVISGTSALIGQHGAGLVNSLFMNADAVLVELKREGIGQHFETLSAGLGREYRVFYLDEDHATLTPALIEQISDFVWHRC